MFTRVFSTFLFSLFLCATHVASLFGQTEPFYKNKTITIVTGYSTGGTMDGWARLMAQYLGRHIPGNPNAVVRTCREEVPWSRPITSTKWPSLMDSPLVYSAPELSSAIKQKEVQFEWQEFSWIGSPELTDESLYIRADTPYKSFEDIRKVPGQIRCGAGNRGSSSYYIPKIVEDITGVRFNMVTGYPGTADANLALEKGEIHCRATSLGSVFGPSRTHLVKNPFHLHPRSHGGEARS